MPTPSTWAVGVAAPANTDPYQGLEAITAVPGARGGAGALAFGTAGGEVVPPERVLSGHWTEILDWKESPAAWILVALIAIGVLHIGFSGKGSAGPAKASIGAEV